MDTIVSAPPQVRVRISHSKTIKEGWGYETTVEIVHPAGTVEHAQDVSRYLDGLLDMARDKGERERDLRNARDGREV